MNTTKNLFNDNAIERVWYSKPLYSIRLLHLLWKERPIQTLASLSLSTGWVYTLLKSELTTSYAAFGWMPWPLAAILCFTMGTGYFFGLGLAGEYETRKITWAQSLLFFTIALHMDPITQTTGLVTYLLLSGALASEAMEIEKAGKIV